MLTDVSHAKRTLFDVVDGSVGVLKRTRRDPVRKYAKVYVLQCSKAVIEEFTVKQFGNMIATKVYSRSYSYISWY